ncbi:hypothetical protein BLOT_009964 [Blomia tropicalis]|nr:hypothetical protein BLOT_009964 [Blomia tropicalis]
MYQTGKMVNWEEDIINSYQCRSFDIQRPNVPVPIYIEPITIRRLPEKCVWQNKPFTEVWYHNLLISSINFSSIGSLFFAYYIYWKFDVSNPLESSNRKVRKCLIQFICNISLHCMTFVTIALLGDRVINFNSNIPNNNDP